VWQGPMVVDGKASLVFEDNTQLNNFLNNSQPALKLTWTASGANPNTLTVQMTKCNFESFKPKYTGTSAGYIEADLTFRGLGNTTDANTAGGGYSPARVSLGNAKATGTFQ
jgi:hypothetical protein